MRQQNCEKKLKKKQQKQKQKNTLLQKVVIQKCMFWMILIGLSTFWPH